MDMQEVSKLANILQPSIEQIINDLKAPLSCYISAGMEETSDVINLANGI